MQIGCHGLVWTGDFEGDGVELAVRKTKEAGFDLIEFPLLDPARFNVESARTALERHGIGASASLGLSEATDISSESAAVVGRGAQLLHEAVEVASSLGSGYLCGVLYSALTKYARPPTRTGMENSAAVIREVADHAAGLGMKLGLEVVNRYESNLINTAAQALRYLDIVRRPNVVVHLDTYHMNIEESGTSAPVAECGDRLGYVHIGENHRGYLASGSIAFEELFLALERVRYRGPIVFESFSSMVVSPALSNTLGIWRELWSDSDDLARHAERTIRALAASARKAYLSDANTAAPAQHGLPGRGVAAEGPA